jgi:hypothetical protein
MLIADIKVVPYGDWDNLIPVRRLFIANVGADEDNLHKYVCWFGKPDQEFVRIPDVSFVDHHGVGLVSTFTHDRSHGAEHCVRLALESLL